MKSVLITGANRGIGFETVRAFGRAGYRVFATMRNPENATVLKQKIKEESLNVSIYSMDVNSDGSVKQCIKKYDSESIYPNSRRIAELFSESLKTPRPASQVGEKILEFANSNSWQLRHPVGPDALPFLGWRASMTDEQWIEWNAANDEDYYNAVERDFGMNLRPVEKPIISI